MTACDDDTRPRESEVVTAVVVGERESKQQLVDVMERIKRKEVRELWPALGCLRDCGCYYCFFKLAALGVSGGG